LHLRVGDIIFRAQVLVDILYLVVVGIRERERGFICGRAFLGMMNLFHIHIHIYVCVHMVTHVGIYIHIYIYIYI
jgi:hypothetical protein